MIYDDSYEKQRLILGKTIKHLREDRDYTQEQLADRARINVSYLAKIENGYVNTTVRYLVKIAKGLRVKVRDLFEF